MRYEINKSGEFSAYDDYISKEPLASAICRSAGNDKKRAVLTEIYQSEKCPYAAGALLSYIEHVLAHAGLEYLELAYVSDVPSKALFKELAENEGYRLKSGDWTILGFSYDKIKNSKKLNAYRTDKKNTGSYLTRSQLEGYSNDIEVSKSICGQVFDDIDLKYSRFYIDEDRIAGCVIVDEFTEQSLCITDMYLKAKYNPAILLRLLASVLLDDSVIKRPPEYLIANCTKHHFIRLFASLFGEADMSRNIAAYTKRLT